MTTIQLALTLSPLVEPDYTPDLTIGQRFELFNRANPHVADALESLAAQWLARHAHVGMKALYERLRWESGIRTDGNPYRLNNDFTALYSRLLIERRPEWSEAFRLRELRAA